MFCTKVVMVTNLWFSVMCLFLPLPTGNRDDNMLHLTLLGGCKDPRVKSERLHFSIITASGQSLWLCPTPVVTADRYPGEQAVDVNRMSLWTWAILSSAWRTVT